MNDGGCVAVPEAAAIKLTNIWKDTGCKLRLISILIFPVEVSDMRGRNVDHRERKRDEKCGVPHPGTNQFILEELKTETRQINSRINRNILRTHLS